MAGHRVPLRIALRIESIDSSSNRRILQNPTSSISASFCPDRRGLLRSKHTLHSVAALRAVSVRWNSRRRLRSSNRSASWSLRRTCTVNEGVASPEKTSKDRVQTFTERTSNTFWSRQPQRISIAIGSTPSTPPSRYSTRSLPQCQGQCNNRHRRTLQIDGSHRRHNTLCPMPCRIASHWDWTLDPQSAPQSVPQSGSR